MLSASSWKLVSNYPCLRNTKFILLLMPRK